MEVKASLYAKNNLYYVILSYRNADGKRKQKWIPTGIKEKGNNKRLANAKLEEIKQNYRNYIEEKEIKETKDSNIYFEKYLREWLESHKYKIEENTYYSYNTMVEKITEYFEDKKIRLKDLKPSHIQKFYNYLYAKRLCGNSVLHYHAVIRNALNSAVKLDIILTNPADKVERTKKNQFIGDFYTIEELEELYKVIKGDPIEIVILLSSFYGTRRSETLGLKWNAFDFTNNTITIRHKVIETIIDGERKILFKDKTKNSSSYRSLPLVDEVKEALLKHKEQIKKNMEFYGSSYNMKYKDYVCVNSEGKVFRPEYITDHFQIILKNNGLRHIRFHDLRHSVASLLLSRNVPMKAIQEWLGHSTYSTTANIYAHLESNTKEISANVLANVINF